MFAPELRAPRSVTAYQSEGVLEDTLECVDVCDRVAPGFKHFTKRGEDRLLVVPLFVDLLEAWVVEVGELCVVGNAGGFLRAVLGWRNGRD